MCVKEVRPNVIAVPSTLCFICRGTQQKLRFALIVATHYYQLSIISLKQRWPFCTSLSWSSITKISEITFKIKAVQKFGWKPFVRTNHTWLKKDVHRTATATTLPVRVCQVQDACRLLLRQRFNPLLLPLLGNEVCKSLELSAVQ